jgi:WD40 repeat protein
VRGLAFSKDGETLVTGGLDDTLIWWPANAAKPEPIRKVKAHAGWIRALDVSPDGKLLASGGNDRILKIWNLADGKPVRQLTGHELDIYSVMFHPDGQHLLAGDLMGHIRQWEISTGKLVRKFEAKDLHTYNGGQKVHFGGVRSLALSPDKKHLVAGGLYKGTNPLGAVSEPLILRFDWASQKVLKKHITDGVKGVIWRTLFHPDGFLIGASGGSGGGYLLFWETDKDKAFHKFKMPDTAREMDLHPDGVMLATVHYGRKLRLSKLAPKPKPPPKKK